MGRFFDGIGKARCERVTSIELLWQGALMPQHPTRVNQRTKPLLYFTRLKNLQTLLVFIAESDEKRMRRNYDMQDKSHYSEDYTESDIWTLDAFESMMKQTATHPNFRGNRSMRTTHGMDYIYQLRGMSWVRFREVSRNRVAIRDWSFAADIATQVTMPKSQIAKREAEIENLADLCGEWDPSDLAVELVKSFYQPSSLDYIVGGSETSASDAGSISLGSDSDSSFDRSPSPSPDPSDDSGSDSGGPGGGNPRDMFPDEMDEIQYSSRGNSPSVPFPDELDSDSGVEDLDMDETRSSSSRESSPGEPFPDELESGSDDEDVEMDEIQSSSRRSSPEDRFPDEMDYDSGIEDVDIDVPVSGEEEDSNENISESSKSSSDGFDGDDKQYETQNNTTQSTSGEQVDDDVHSVGHSTSLFVRSNSDDAEDGGNSVAQSRRAPRSAAESSRGEIPPPQGVIDLTLGGDDESTEQGQQSNANDWDADSLFVQSKSGGSSDEFVARNVVDLTGDDGDDGDDGDVGDDRNDGEEQTGANRVKAESLKLGPDDSSASTRSGSEHPKRQRQDDTSTEPLQKRPRNETSPPPASA
jgi:hypothetical protein